MGNHNSGRHTNRLTTDDMYRLDIREAQRNGQLVEGCYFTWSWGRRGWQTDHSATITVHSGRVFIEHECLRMAGELVKGRYAVQVEYTACHFGGRRAWWRCPGDGCGRRVAILYARKGQIFACRHCHELNYRSQRETDENRLIRRLGKLRARLGWKPGLLNGNGGKPCRMRWQTFERLHAEHEKIKAVLLDGLCRQFGIS